MRITVCVYIANLIQALIYFFHEPFKLALKTDLLLRQLAPLDNYRLSESEVALD